MAGVVEESDCARPRGLQVPRVGIDGAVEGAEAGVAYRHNLKAKTLQGLLKEPDIIVRVRKPSYLASVGFIADQQRDALLGLRDRS